jgi:hypothetical protein
MTSIQVACLYIIFLRPKSSFYYHNIHKIPTIAQYTANHINLPRFTNSIIHLQAKHPITKAAMKPTAIGNQPMDSVPAIASLDGIKIFFKSNNASPKIGIITMKNENDATCSRLSPMMIPVAMVLPERLNPGNTATAWAMPMINASVIDMLCGRKLFPLSN